MILGIGIDTVEVKRFANWHTKSEKQLLRIFSQLEVAYCLNVRVKSAERFAVRFAAREALYKGLSQAFPDYKIPFLTLCQSITITTSPAPSIEIKKGFFPSHTILLSFTHTHRHATALLMILPSKSFIQLA